MLAGLLEVIPDSGPIAAGVPLVAFATARGLTTGLLALGIAVGVQQVEGNLIQPLIMARTVALHPAVVEELLVRPREAAAGGPLVARGPPVEAAAEVAGRG